MSIRSRTISLILRALLLVAPALSPPAPAGAAVCLTHVQARAAYPHQHLYWHSESHCWDDNRRPREHYDAPAAPTKIGLAVDQATASVHTTVYYPSLIHDWPLGLLPLQHVDMSSWPVLLDVDQPAKFDRWRDRVLGVWSK